MSEHHDLANLFFEYVLGEWPERRQSPITVHELHCINAYSYEEISSARGPEILPAIISRLKVLDKKLTSLDLLPQNEQALRDRLAALNGAEQSEELALGGVHILDGLLAVYFCCDEVARGRVCSLLLKNQLAIPFLLRDPSRGGQLVFCIDSLCWLRKQIGKRDIHLAEHELDVVACMRLGPCTHYSKSFVLQQTLKVHGFWNRHKVEAFFPRYLADGMAQIAWTSFPDSPEPRAIVNLRGDALKHATQREFLAQVATVLVVFVDEFSQPASDQIAQFEREGRPLIVYSTSPSWKQVARLNNGPKLLKTLQTALQQHSKPRKLRDCIEQAYLCGIEANGFSVYDRALENTRRLLDHFDNFPIQDELLSTFMNCDRERYGNKDFTKCEADIRFSRVKQLDQMRKSVPFLREFTKFVGFDNAQLSEEQLATLLLLSEVIGGLDRIMREMGQLHDCFLVLGDAAIEHNLCVQQAVTTAAKLLRHGFLFELVIGEDVYLPELWVDAVLRELAAQMGPGQKIHSISALGLQSSGKSTLLNSMFGLTLRYSVGQCTRGVSMVLLPVAAESRPVLGYDALAVLDVEGLRTQDKPLVLDNELATFVIGVSHLTMLTVMSEIDTAKRDTLEIYMHAVARMKSIDVYPSLLCVHQNIARPNDKGKLHDEKCKLKKQLDEVARRAKADVESAQELLNYDPTEFLNVVASYVKGREDFQRVQRLYVETVAKTRHEVLLYEQTFTNENRSPSKPCTVNEFCDKILEFYQRVRQEDFVFKKLNSQAIVSDRMIKGALNDLNIDLNDAMVDAVRRAEFLLKNRGNPESIKSRAFETFAKQVESRITQFHAECKKEQSYSESTASIKFEIDDMVEKLTAKLNKQLLNAQQTCRKTESPAERLQRKINDEIFKEARNNRNTDQPIQQRFNVLWGKIFDAFASNETRTAAPQLILDCLRKEFRDKSIDFGDKPSKKFVFNSKVHLKIRDVKERFNISILNTLGPHKTVVKFEDSLLANLNRNVKYYFLKKMEDFSTETITNFLVMIKNLCTEQDIRKSFKVTEDFLKEYCVWECHRNLDRFEELREKSDPLHQRMFYLDRFREACHNPETLAEIELSDTLFKQISPPLSNYLVKLSLEDIYRNNEDLRGGRKLFFKVELRKLMLEKSFQNVWQFVSNPHGYLMQRIGQRVKAHFDKVAECELKELISTRIKELETKVKQIPGGGFDKFHEYLNEEFQCDLAPHECLTKVSPEELVNRLLKVIRPLEARLQERSCKDYLIKECELMLGERCNGCKSVCPYCSAPCELTEANHDGKLHRTTLHWPFAITGRKTDDAPFDLTSCAELCRDTDSSSLSRVHIQLPAKRMHALKEHKWHLRVADCVRLKLWDWLLVTFKKEFKKEFGGKFASLPADFFKITEDSVELELENL